MAIHDREYASRPETWEEFRWRIQYLAELGIGRLLRREQMRDDEAFQAAMSNARGSR